MRFFGTAANLFAAGIFGVILSVFVQRPLEKYLDAHLPPWLSADAVGHALLYLGLTVIAAGAGVVGGLYGAKDYMRHVMPTPRRLTFKQKEIISKTFKRDFSEWSRLIYITPFKNDECVDFAEDLASAFRMIDAITRMEDAYGAPRASARDVVIRPYDGKTARAEVMVSLLKDFGFQARIGEMISVDGPLFTIEVNRPS